MAAAYGIVRNHDGLIVIDSELGKGTVVRIYLPAVEVEIKEPKETKVEVSSGTGTILVIEDEQIVLDVTRALLERLGYRVLEAMTGKEAVDIVEGFDGNIDLALLDIRLPDMDGGKAYPIIKEARPNLKVIVCSGYAIDGPAQEVLDAGAQDFIQKPYSLSTLSKKLKKVFENK
jgi:two-component system cell cycle sensor histidine kinase/response regulator CckA